MARASRSRIPATHCGSLPRPASLLDLLQRKAAGEPYDEAVYADGVRAAVAECVRQQLACGIDIPTDGEQGKPGFFTYIGERLSGFEAQPGPSPRAWTAEIEAFPEYYEQYFSHAMLGGAIAPVVPLVCTGPVSYRGQEAVRRDIDNLKSALAGNPVEAFLPSVAPTGIGRNAYYKTEEEYLAAAAEAMRSEYLAITGAGLTLQIDDPFLTDLYSYPPAGGAAAQSRLAGLHVESLNHALRGIPPEQIRFHTCYGINHGPRVHDAPLAAIAGKMLQVNAGAYSFEAANPRHEHEYRLWESLALPDGRCLIPGVVTHASNIVEHPEWIAERILRYARIVGRERVIAGTDCGFSSQASYRTEVHPKVVWAKFRALAEGAALATRALWP